MSAQILSMDSYRMAHPSSPQKQPSVIDEVIEKLAGKVSDTILHKAVVRATNLREAKRPHDECVRRACAWALYVVHADEPKGAA